MRHSAALDRIGTFVLYVLVPLWIAVGAITKLVFRDPTTLPKLIIDIFGQPGLDADLGLVLRFFIGLELAAIGIIWLVPRLARAVATFILASFIVTLLATIFVYGADKCGCFGSFSPPPWAMIGIDTVLLAIVLFACRGIGEAEAPSWNRFKAAMIWTLSAFFIVAIVPPRARAIAEPVEITDPVDGQTAQVDPSPCGHPVVTPGDYWQPDFEAMLGKRWDELELASFLCEWPRDWDQGERWILLYKKDCDHCEEILFTYFNSDGPIVPGILERTTLYSTPNPEGFPPPTFESPCLECQEVDLPIGPIWVYTTPVIIQLQDGVVTCASEGEDLGEPQCLNFF